MSPGLKAATLCPSPKRRGPLGRAPVNLLRSAARRGGAPAPAPPWPCTPGVYSPIRQRGGRWFGPQSLRTSNQGLRRAGSPRLPFPPLLHPRVRPCVSVLLLGIGRACEGLEIGVVYRAAYFDTHFGLLFVLFSSGKRLLPSSKTCVEKGLFLHVTRPPQRPPTAKGGN